MPNNPYLYELLARIKGQQLVRTAKRSTARVDRCPSDFCTSRTLFMLH
jgi:hypothetical protein